MRYIQRLLATGVAVAAIMSWSLLEFGQETNPSQQPDESKGVYDVSQEATSGPEATDERDSMGALGIADLRREVALLRSDLSEVQDQLRRLMQTSSSSAASRKAAPNQPLDTAQDSSSVPLSEMNRICRNRRRTLSRKNVNVALPACRPPRQRCLKRQPTQSGRRRRWTPYVRLWKTTV